MATRSKPSLLEPAASAAAEESQQLLAVLIDADNAQASTIDGLLAEIAKFGIASVKRAYGDWSRFSPAARTSSSCTCARISLTFCRWCR